jgi:hypothetical protein
VRAADRGREVRARLASAPGWTPYRASRGIYAERAAIGLLEHSRKAQRHQAEYVRWQRCISKLGHKNSPSEIMSAQAKKRFNRKRPRRGAGSAEV